MSHPVGNHAAAAAAAAPPDATLHGWGRGGEVGGVCSTPTGAS